MFKTEIRKKRVKERNRGEEGDSYQCRMVYQSRIRKRVQAIRRAPDGSAFQTCDNCGVSVAIALVDMHDCELKKDVKRFKGECRGGKRKEKRFQDQPRSEFRFFVESFMKTCKAENEIEVDQKGFETWKNMSMRERYPYFLQAEKVNQAYTQALLKEAEEKSTVEDEANSAAVGKFTEKHRDYEYYDESDYSSRSESHSDVNKDGGIRLEFAAPWYGF